MARRDKIKQGLGAVLKSTTAESGEEGTDSSAAPVEETASGRKPASVRRLRRSFKGAPTGPDGERPGDKRHTSVYLYPSEFDLLDDTIYALRRDHGMRIPKTELWRALLHLAGGMMADPERVDELLAACSSVLEKG